ncbi:hypothetical protein [Clostridium perfringens]|uniref:hypothetical protein n=1 Tax=Clostridium perfringens TaxID=1502 RepID=UPI0021A65392|nr:hypothetical protein [Clostridium perfringens]
MGANSKIKRRKEVKRKMLTPGGKLILGIITIVVSLYLSLDFMLKSLDEKKAKESFKYILLSVANMLILIFATNVI